MVEGPTYYYEASEGYGIQVAVKNSEYQPIGDGKTDPDKLIEEFEPPMYEIIVFEDTIHNANAFFSPIVMSGDDKEILIQIDSPSRPKCSLSVYHNKDKPMTQIYHAGDDVRETYIDIDGDYLPDQRRTSLRGGVKKLEMINYSFEEIEQGGGGKGE